MKKILIAGIFLILLLFLIFSIFSLFNKTSRKSYILKPKKISETILISPTEKEESKIEEPSSISIFFPYWLLPDNADGLALPELNQFANQQVSEYIYFGITANGQGVDRKESGYLNMQKFVDLQFPSDSKQLLTLRLINEDITLPILENTADQNRLIEQTVFLAKEFGFEGIVVDLEVSAIATEKLIDQINNFVKNFYERSKSEDIELQLTLYGDVFIRNRPYDLNELCSYTDKILIMAYDFHKSYGEPGPNFPLQKEDIYSYDLKQMTEDFLSNCSRQKLSIIFGLFGYDWKVDDQNRPLKRASALTLAQAKARYLSSCDYPDCKVSTDQVSSETNVTYTGEDGYTHQVWFETTESIEDKIDFALSKGISDFSLWAWGYY